MKCYANKTRLLKRVVFRTKEGDKLTQYLGFGQKVHTNDQALFVDSGIKVSDVTTPKKKTASKKDTTENTENTDTGKE